MLCVRASLRAHYIGTASSFHRREARTERVSCMPLPSSMFHNRKIRDRNIFIPSRRSRTKKGLNRQNNWLFTEVRLRSVRGGHNTAGICSRAGASDRIVATAIMNGCSVRLPEERGRRSPWSGSHATGNVSFVPQVNILYTDPGLAKNALP